MREARKIPATAWLALGFLIPFAGSPSALAITAGQHDDFQNGTTQSWAGNSGPTNIANGGPDGVGDRYLQISANGFPLGTKNTAQWAGNYLAAGVDELQFDLKNFGPNPVALRISLAGPLGQTTFTSTTATVLPSGSGWVTVSFGIAPTDLTRMEGAGSYAETLGAVTTLLIRHDPDPISPPMEPNVAMATLGIDNVLPEPSSPLLPVLLAAALLASPRARAASVRAARPRRADRSR
jgi:hypothetical protein